MPSSDAYLQAAKVVLEPPPPAEAPQWMWETHTERLKAAQIVMSTQVCIFGRLIARFCSHHLHISNCMCSPYEYCRTGAEPFTHYLCGCTMQTQLQHQALCVGGNAGAATATPHSSTQ